MPASSAPSAEWRALLRLLPGYDPFADAEGCWFDADEAQRALDFFPKYLRHVEGALTGRPFELAPWQQSFVANLFGWRMRDEVGRDVRRYREALLYVPRKNGKSPLVAGLAAYVLFCDPEKGQQNYVAAADREQAGKLFRHCKGMVERCPALRARCRVYGGTAAAGQSKSIVRPEDGSFLQVISADAETKHGGNTHLAIVDELHTQPDRDLFEVLETSTASLNRAQPLLISITTADYEGRDGVCNDRFRLAQDVRDGVRKDKRFLPALYYADKEEDWTAEEVWRKANPNLGVSVSLDYLRRQVENRRGRPTAENEFKRLHLNMQTPQAVANAIPMDRWDACGEGAADPMAWRLGKLEELKGCECWAGLDIGSVGDLTALCLLFRTEGGVTLLPWFWVPRDNAEKRQRQDRVPYLDWIDAGWITATEGDVCDYDTVRADIMQVLTAYPNHELAVDRLFQGVQLATQLMEDGHTVWAFGQGYTSMAGPTRQFLELVSARRVRHGNNPVLRWMARNAAAETATRKAADGRAEEVLKFSKKHSSEKIDGIIAAVMAVGRASLAGLDAAPSITML